jgi:ligand-binding SRPBCC domain-containing protein
MKIETFEKKSRIEAPVADLWAFHRRPDAFERLVMPGDRVTVLERDPDGLKAGSRMILRVGGKILGSRWVARIAEVGSWGFRDVMEKGPFAHWEHRHEFRADGPDASVLLDRVEYAVPFGALGRFLGGWFIRRKLAKLFSWRHEVTAREVTVREVAA